MGSMYCSRRGIQGKKSEVGGLNLISGDLDLTPRRWKELFAQAPNIPVWGGVVSPERIRAWILDKLDDRA